MSWYETFFGEDYVRFHLLGGEWLEERNAQQCDFLERTLNLEPGARVLDLCCGQGRISVELARRGYQVTGLDLSEYLLGLARERAQAAGVEVEWVRRDMRDLPWREEFDAIVSVFTSFGYLETDEEDGKVLVAAGRALKPGGGLVLCLHNREQTALFFQPKCWTEHEGHLVLDESTWDERAGRIRMTRTIVAPDGARRQTGFVLRFYAPSELARMLARAGLDWTETYGDYDASSYHALCAGCS